MDSIIRVLLVDDHPMVRDGLRSMLSDPAVAVVGEAGNGQEGIEQMRRLKPDVVLLDIRMPGLDGLAALQRIREEQLPGRVIMVTTYQNTAYLVRALVAGAAGFVLKDISREALLDTVKAVAAGASRVDRPFLERVLHDLDHPEPLSSAETELLEPLTPREMDILRLVVEGLTNQAIGQVLHLSAGTVKGYVQTILQKLNTTDRTQAAVKAIRLGLVQ